MGLDMYAYTAQRAGQYADFWDGAQLDEVTGEYVNTDVEKPVEIAHWRKHPHFHGWMNNLWESQGNSGEFNGDELELTTVDLDALQIAVESGSLPPTSGFFFGGNADEHYKQADRDFITHARTAIRQGLRVFYNSSW